jgi:hypothetical protein
MLHELPIPIAEFLMRLIPRTTGLVLIHLQKGVLAAVDQPPNYVSLPSGWDEFPESPPSSDLLITKRHWGAFYGTGR